MIFGPCPYCDEIVANAIPDETPVFGKTTCENCGKEYWLRYSRISPEAYTKEQFEDEYEINKETKVISLKRKNLDNVNKEM